MKKPAQFQTAVSICQFLCPGTTLYPPTILLLRYTHIIFALHLSCDTYCMPNFAPPDQPLSVKEPECKVDWHDPNIPAPIWFWPITTLLMWLGWWCETGSASGNGGNWWDTTTPTLLGFRTTTAFQTWWGWSVVTGSASRGSGNALSCTAVEARLGVLLRGLNTNGLASNACTKCGTSCSKEDSATQQFWD